MSVLQNLEPKEVYSYFEEICAIPHGSYHTQAISDYLVEFAKKHNLKYRQDEATNVVIWKDATPGYENSPTVMIQGHIDMVCEKTDDCTKDMEKEGLDLFIDGDLLGAKGTTLGGDDGIAVAMGLAILAADNIPHGPLECLFTANEEVGMLGARALDASDLKAKYLLNLDSEADKILTVSCAGTTRSFATFPIVREAFKGDAFTLSVTGLIGGHSGEEIHKGRANANNLLGRALCGLENVCQVRIVSLAGGTKENAITLASSAVIVVDDSATAKKYIEELNANVRNEYRTPDPDIQIVLASASADKDPMTAKLTNSIACFLFTAPCGLQVMSPEVKGLVQTSLNMGRLITEEDKVIMHFMIRSSVNSQRDEVSDKVAALAKSLGGSYEIGACYSAWEYMKESPLRDMMIEAFRDVYKEEPKVEALHAGLECGILSGKMPGLDAISYGPDLTDIHTPRERLHIESAMRIWKLTLEILKRLK